MDRLWLGLGPTPPDEREAIKHAFNARPDQHPLRILIATDAAREGLNLQAHCWNLFHFDVPWNPKDYNQRDHVQAGTLHYIELTIGAWAPARNPSTTTPPSRSSTGRLLIALALRLGEPHARIERRVEHVHHEVDEQVEGGPEEGDAHDHRVVALEHRAHQGPGLSQQIAIFTAVLATIGAVVSFLGGHTQNEALLYKNEAVLERV